MTTLTTATQVRIFAKHAAYDTGAIVPGALAVADVNGDGIPDVLVGNSSSVMVLLGNGDGTLQAPTAYDIGSSEPASIAVGDVNADGHPDLIVATSFPGDPNSGGVAVFLGRGDGTFRSPLIFRSGGFGALGVAIADVNRDGRPDLIVANVCQTPPNCYFNNPGSVGVLLGNGDGTFKSAISYTSVGNTQGMAVADLNGDGTPDVVVEGIGTDIGVLLGNGDGTFQPLVGYYPSAGGTEALAIGDVNGDGKPDLVLCPGGLVAVLLGNGDGTFQAPISASLPVGDDFSIAVKDLDGDGKLDVVLGGHFTHSAYALLGNGDGTFRAAETYGLDWSETQAVALADLNADGKPDLLAIGRYCPKCTDTLTLHVLLNIFDAPTVGALTSSPNPSAVGQPVTFTATLTSDPPVPDGEVITFANGANILGTGTAKNGVASVTTSFSLAGTHTIKAEYPGDLFHKAITPTVPQHVALYSTTTALSVSPNPSAFGQAVVLRAVVTTTGSTTPTGKVTFKNGSAALAAVALDSTGTATLTTAKLPVGSDSITASYGGDSLNLKSKSSVIVQTVN